MLNSSANRMSRLRQRKRDGTVMVNFEISATGALALSRLGWLAAEELANPSAVARAVLGIAGKAVLSGMRPKARSENEQLPIV